MSEFLHIRLGNSEQPVDLGLLEQFAEHLRGALRELAREEGAEGKIQVRLDVQDAQKGSLILVLEPRLSGEKLPDSDLISRKLITDINAIAEDLPRTTMGTGLLQQYRALVGVGQKAGGLQVRHGDQQTSMGPEQEISFRAALKDQIETATDVVGTIEMVSIHSRPWRFGLYTKLDRERVECRFDDTMLEQVLGLMERKALVEVSGEAHFGPVGITPRLIVLDKAPTPLEFDREGLLAFRRSANIIRDGETAVEAVARVREAMSLYA